MDLPLLQNNKFTSWNFPNLKTFIQDEQTMEADCNKQAKTVINPSNHLIKAFRDDKLQ